ncbi:MAG: hypothetical protein E7582_02555 [Ruminococcaceae bacterium]|nr:hypothetical protein [Oscillospiraceae bacterium]
MTDLLNTITSFLDVISNETNIIVKDKDNHYYESEMVLIELAKMWDELSNAKRNRISRAYMDGNMRYYSNKKECDELLYKTTKLQLASLIQPIENIAGEHIVYDCNNRKFMLSTEATDKNLINCWHFKTKSKKNNEVCYILNKINITKHRELLEFLLQEIEFPELYFHLLS